MYQTEKLTRDQVASILESKQLSEWLTNVKPSKEGYVVLNNSYLFRENIKTTKSKSYLAVPLGIEKGSPKFGDIVVVTGITINTDFQYFPKTHSDISKAAPLTDSISEHVKRFGKVGFVLIGKILDDVTIREPIDEAGIVELVLNPAEEQNVKVDSGKIIIRELLDDETLWLELGKKLDPLPEELATPIAKALNNLREQAYVRLKIPSKVKDVNRTLIDDIVSSFEGAIKEYRSSLDKCKGDYRTDPDEFNNILRIGYNFAGDAMDLLKLVLQLSDLKPIVLFSTVNTQLTLSNSFKELPWPRAEKKGSLKLYDRTVKGARNRAFHRLFPFSKAIEVDVAGLSFKAKKLRLFPEFGAHKSNALDYEDRELVELMTQFTRTTEHTVTPVFWQKNLAVMENTVALLKQIKAALISILADKNSITL